MDFVPPKWQPFVVDNQSPTERRHYYELCALLELRAALRSGDAWLEHSRRYADPETYLISRNRWPEVRSEVSKQIGVSEDSACRLEDREAELQTLFPRVDALLAQSGNVRIENGELVVSPLEAEDVPETAAELASLIDQRLPRVDLSELVIEVDGWTEFTRCFEHAGGAEPRSPNLRLHLYASLLAQGCNLGLGRMAQIADVAYHQLAWSTNWYLRDETLKAAVTNVVNFQFQQPLSRHWGGGTLSSSDGQRFPVSGKVLNATALPRYFGYGKGVTFYTWTSDQFSQYGIKGIRCGRKTWRTFRRPGTSISIRTGSTDLIWTKPCAGRRYDRSARCKRSQDRRFLSVCYRNPDPAGRSLRRTSLPQPRRLGGA